MNAGSVTVIVPTRHRPQYVRVAVLSILASAAELALTTPVRTRVLICDDAPDNDDTKDLARQLGVDYARVHEHDGRADPGAAIALGVSRVDTSHQLIFGDDDLMLVRHLPLAWAKVVGGADVVSSSYQLAAADLAPARTVVLPPTCLGDLLAGHTLVNDGSLVAHDLVADLDWDASLEGQMLLPIWGELMLAGRRFDRVTEPTWLYRRHGANISSAALSPHDLGRRAEAQERLRQRALDMLGSVPQSPYAAQLAEKSARAERSRRLTHRVVRRLRAGLARRLSP